MTDITDGARAPQAAPAANTFYFIAWRWHFYAGLYVMPFLIMSALTGLTMLWISWISGIQGERIAVSPQAAPLAVSALQVAAEAAVPNGTATQYVEPLAADRAAAFAIATDGGSTGVVIDPYTGAVLDVFPWGNGWYDFATDIHGTLLIGTLGDRLIEIAASLAVVMVLTGIYLQWPRNGSPWWRAVVPRVSARGRSLWKTMHGAVGFCLSLFILIFLVSGLSWAGIWGERMVQAWNTFPAEKFSNVPPSTPDGHATMDHGDAAPMTHADMNHGNAKEVPWTLEQTPLPASGSLAGTEAIAGDVTIDSVVSFARELGFTGRFQVNFPAGETGVWTISHDSMSNDGPNPAADRTIHIDRYSGNILADVQYADYSLYAKGMAWGIAFHEGDLGVWNLVLNTLVCFGVVGLSVSGFVMWWRRRPSAAARLAAPPRPRDARIWKGAAILVIALGVVFPMAGAAIVAVLLFDLLVLRFVPSLKKALS